ncbi:MAG: RtcB family protein [Myxococcaceae bacterium]|nr:RtcB family protein [Myxococcaceae bacterium]
MPLTQVAPYLHEVPTTFRADMRVPARVIADEALLQEMRRDHSLLQLVNVTTLPGILGAALGMPDMHEGYGFPVGGVAATVLPDGVISPGGIGFDINCGVRLLASELTRGQVAEHLEVIVHELSRSVPTGFGRGGRLHLSPEEMDQLLNEGVPFLVGAFGLGSVEDLAYLESGGRLPGASSGAVSVRARQRGQDQLGTLGSGNHFLEVQVVDEVFDARAAKAFGLFEGQVTVLIHTGSRGLGHQVCTDAVRVMDNAMQKYGIQVPDRQLACTPFSSKEGASYFAGMCAAANFAFCNRQVITQRARDVFARVLAGNGLPSRLRVVYDVAHNTAKLETHRGRKVCVHRKGATRAFGPSEEEVPAAYREVGQPVFIPGTMGTASFVLVGQDRAREVSFSSTCHGAGRSLSRSAAKRRVVGHELRHAMEKQGIVVRCASNAELAEEAPMAYKDVERVVDAVHQVGIAGKVARLRPLGVLKG